MTTLPVLAPASLTQGGTISTGETILFAVVAGVTVACGFGLLTAKRAVSAAVNLIGIMIGLAVLYIAGEAPFLGITQVVVYTGAVMTLVLFVVMLVGVGGDEPVSTGSAATTWLVGIFGLGLVVALVGAVAGSASPAAKGLDSGARATPAQLAVALFSDHVVVMELTGLLLIIAAVGALALTHRERIRPRITQRATARAKMRAYAERGAHPGQKPMSGVFAATNTAAAPALDADGEAVEESVPRVLRVRGQGLELAEVSPESSAARAAGRNRADVVDVARSGMASMPGAAAPAVVQPLAPAERAEGDEGDGPGEPDGSARGAESDGSAEPAEGAEDEGPAEPDAPAEGAKGTKGEEPAEPDGGSPAGSEEKKGAAK